MKNDFKHNSFYATFSCSCIVNFNKTSENTSNVQRWTSKDISLGILFDKTSFGNLNPKYCTILKKWLAKFKFNWQVV